MKKLICILICAAMLISLCACTVKKKTDTGETPAPAPEGQEQTEQPAAEWTREGYFIDENGNLLSVTRTEDGDEPGWYVGVAIGELMAGGTLEQEENTLSGSLSTEEEGAEPIAVTVSEEGEDGVLFTIEGGESYHFTPMPEATIFVSINTEGWGGMIEYAAGKEAPEIDPDWPYQSAQINLDKPEVYTFIAAPEAGSLFVKWTKDGKDFSTEPVITVMLEQSADFVAVFEEDPGWQNPVMNFVGEYQSGRAHALVECFGNDEAWITIEWGSSAWELAHWDIVGRLNLDTLSIKYSGATMQTVTYADNGEEKSRVTEYDNGTGTITFNDDGTFTWHEDQSAYGTDMVFEWVPVEPKREDGERFEAVIILEGMEETVQYEHVVNEELGFEIDYDYESLERYSDTDMECFISVWDGPGNPENFLEIMHDEQNAEAVAARVKEELSQEYDLLESTRELERAGECVYIEAAVIKGTNNMADELQAVYIIPASEGCFVATAHFAAEAAEGFGHRFNYMLQTFSELYS